MTEKLLPCPFCGGAAVAFQSGAPKPQAYWATCTNDVCGAEVRGSATREETTALWNRRAPTPEPRSEAFECAAVVAETYDHNGMFADGLPKGWAGCRRGIAAAIRALAIQSPKSVISAALGSATYEKIVVDGVTFTPESTPPAAILSTTTYSREEYDEAYEMGERDGFSDAVQKIDQLTGGDGEYRYCLGHEDSVRHMPDPATMIKRIADRFKVLNLLDEATKDGGDQPDDSPSPEPTVRPQVEDETEILQRLAGGDTIVFSQDGDMAWFTGGDRATVGDAIMSLRTKGFLTRRCDDEENYRGTGEYDTISDAGCAALAATTEGSDNG